MKFQNQNPTQQSLPDTLYGIALGTPPVVVCVCIDPQTADAIKGSAYPTATVIPGTLVD